MRKTERVAWRFNPPPVVAVALLCLAAAGCAKIGDPQPPSVDVLRPATDLEARQFAGRVLLTVTLPTQYTTGISATEPDTAQVLRIIEPDRMAVTPLPEDVFLARATPLATKTPAELAAKAKNGRLVVEDELNSPDPSTTYTRAFRYAVRFINAKNETAGLSNQVVIAPIPLPAPPDRVRLDLGQDRIRLTWDAPSKNVDGSQPVNLAGYNVYRSESSDVFSGAPRNAQPLPQPEFEDREFDWDKTYYYKVSIVGRTATPYAETAASPALEVATRDTFPPGAPLNLNAVVESGVVFLLWSAPPGADVAGYRIYRVAEGAPREQLEAELVKEPSYRDAKAQPGRKYVYSVHAIDTHGNEGPAAEAAVTIP